MLAKFSLRAKLTIFFVLIIGGSLTGYSVFLYRSFKQINADAFDMLIYNRAVEIAEHIDVDVFGRVVIDPKGIFADAVRAKRKFFPVSDREFFFQIRAVDGTLINKSPTLGKFEIPLAADKAKELLSINWTPTAWTQKGLVPRHDTFRVINYAIYGGLRQPRLIMQIAVPDRPVKRNNAQVLRVFQISIPLILLFSAIVGFYFSDAALEPIRRIIAKARSINANKLTERLPLPVAEDDLRDLVVTLNDLLGRLEKSFNAQERFVADASHQLKTPLAVMKVEVEQLAQKVPEGLDNGGHLKSICEELDHLIHLVQDLLVLARVDTEGDVLQRESLRIDEAVMSAVGKVSTLAQRKDIKMAVNFTGSVEGADDDRLKIFGDDDLLISMFTNLLENSIKYSPPSAQVQIQIQPDIADVRVKIRDQGEGIPDEDAAKIFSRFYRGKSATQKAVGSGLGLSIAKKIADLHDAELTIYNLPQGGAEVQVQIKKV